MVRNTVIAGVCLVLLTGCGVADYDEAYIEPGEDPRSDDLRVLDAQLGSVNMHSLLTDADMAGGERVTVAQVQKFLKAKGSFLAGYTDPKWNKSAAALIVERSRSYGINPIYILARIETESGLVRNGTSRNLEKATGCGCPDSGGCSASWAGFGNQIECSAAKFRGYLDDLEGGGSTVSGWKVGLTKKTLDGCSVKPANAATAALYTYTPWVGAYASGCGTSKWGGSSLVAILYGSFNKDPIWTEVPPLTTTAIVVENDNSRNDQSVARSALSANWTSASSAAGLHGGSYSYASVGAVSDTADFWFFMPDAGTRTIDAWWTSGANRSSTAPFIIENASGTVLARVSADQQVDGGKWNALGTFGFSQGWNRVRLSRWTTTGSVVVADAVRIR